MEITGIVLDFTDDLPLGGASVEILDKNNIPLRFGTVTDGNGMFTLNSNLLDNLYNKVSVSFVGYTTQTMTPTAAKGTIYLPRQGQLMDEVVVIGKRNLKKPVLAAMLGMSLLITILIVLAAKLFKTSIIKQTI